MLVFGVRKARSGVLGKGVFVFFFESKRELGFKTILTTGGKAWI